MHKNTKSTRTIVFIMTKAYLVSLRENLDGHSRHCYCYFHHLFNRNFLFCRNLLLSFLETMGKYLNF